MGLYHELSVVVVRHLSVVDCCYCHGVIVIASMLADLSPQSASVCDHGWAYLCHHVAYCCC